jgi:acetoacetyl-CoA synthetase
MSRPLWRPSPERVEAAQLTAFRRAAEERWGTRLPDYAALHRWSVERRDQFWRSVWDFCGVIGEPGERVLAEGDRMPGARFFPEARLSFAENLLRRRDESPALVFRGERGDERRVSWRELRAQVSRLQRWLREAGVGPGDRVAGYLPNLPEAVAAMLSAASLGALWSSCSPDFGTRGALDRLGQIGPKVLFAADGYFYAGRLHDVRPRVAEIRRELPGLEELVLVPYARAEPDLGPLPGALLFEEALASHGPGEPVFERFPFEQPLVVVFSSGTTGPPKCIVHGAGGALLQHLKEHRLQADLRRGDRFFYFTTLGWMMWNWLVSGLASEATLLLYDGSPFHPEPGTLFDLAERERCAVFGVSAKYLDAAQKAALEPARSHDLSPLRTILSTGSPLSPEGFDFVYQRIKADVCLSSISGGTDILSCFVGGDPTGPVFRGEIQAAGLGMDVAVFDEAGRAVREEKGELVCRRAFPSLPLGFWGDPEGARYRAAYFERFPGVWAHGDFAEETARGGFRIHGRSDAVLNPGGVRIGTAELYRPVEAMEEVLEALAVGQQWQGDVRIALFVRLREGLALDDALRERIRDRIRREASPRHVPAVIAQVADLPRTKSGKLAELAVADVVHGRPVRNREALANPEALELFAGRPELAD